MEKKRNDSIILSLSNTLNEVNELVMKLDDSINISISNKKKIPLELLVRIPSRIWYKMHMDGDRNRDNKW